MDDLLAITKNTSTNLSSVYRLRDAPTSTPTP